MARVSVVVPYTDLRPETAAAVGPRARLVDVSKADGYWRLLRTLWRRGDFIVVEHDVVPDPRVLAEMTACPEPWCGVAYPVGNIWGSFLGCTKFLRGLTAKYPDVIANMRVREWDSLDAQLLGYLNVRERWGPHLHWPAAEHLNRRYDPERVFANCGACGGPLRFRDLRAGPELNRCPRCGGIPAYHPLNRPRPIMRGRTANLARLIYVPSQPRRYLNGVPAHDLETDDAALIKQCLESGLYVRAQSSKRLAPPAPIEEPAPQSKEEAPVASTEASAHVPQGSPTVA